MSRRCDLSCENFDPNEHKGGEGGAPLTSFDELRALLKDNGADNGATPQIIGLVAKRTVTRGVAKRTVPDTPRAIARRDAADRPRGDEDSSYALVRRGRDTNHLLA